MNMTIFYILALYKCISIKEEDIDGSNLDASDLLTSRKHFLTELQKSVVL